jgi:hypothetical protein
MKMDLERIGSRHRGNSQHFAAESEELDQIAKEVSFVPTSRLLLCERKPHAAKCRKLNKIWK